MKYYASTNHEIDGWPMTTTAGEYVETSFSIKENERQSSEINN